MDQNLYPIQIYKKDSYEIDFFIYRLFHDSYHELANELATRIADTI